MVTSKEVYQALRRVEDPELKRNVVELGMARDVEVHNGEVSFTLALTTLACPMKDRIVADAKAGCAGAGRHSAGGRGTG